MTKITSGVAIKTVRWKFSNVGLLDLITAEEAVRFASRDSASDEDKPDHLNLLRYTDKSIVRVQVLALAFVDGPLLFRREGDKAQP